MTREFRIKRIYDECSPADGVRVFVDRLWARGVTKDAAKIDLWPKELTPSTELRKWFHEDPSQGEEFQQRYRAELDANLDQIERRIGELGDDPIITLITATKDLENGHAAVLKSWLEARFRVQGAEQ